MRISGRTKHILLLVVHYLSVYDVLSALTLVTLSKEAGSSALPPELNWLLDSTWTRRDTCDQVSTVEIHFVAALLLVASCY